MPTMLPMRVPLAPVTGANEMMDELAQAGQEGRFREALTKYVAPSVLVLDEVGYLTHRPDAANVLFHVVNERHLRHRPILMTTNKPEAAWGQVLHDSDLAEAILDRVLERGRLFELRGASFRTRHLESPLRGARGEAGPNSQAKPRVAPQPIPPVRVGISGIRGSEFPEPTRRKRLHFYPPASRGTGVIPTWLQSTEAFGFPQAVPTA